MKHFAPKPLPSTSRQVRRRGFTLVELLTVIAIIGVLSAMLLPVASSVSRIKKINTAQAELQQIESALENYKAKYGVYPPANGTNYLGNQLYYELSGATTNNGNYQTLDGYSSVSIASFTGQFGGSGILNCSRNTNDPDNAVYAKDFLPGLKASEISYGTNPPTGVGFYYLVTSVGGPDVNYTPLFLNSTANPFRYAYPGINNPNSYDLWVKLVIKGQTNLICNWSQTVQHNTSLP